jgi:hypothetical protein
MNYVGTRDGVKQAVQAHRVVPFDVRMFMPTPPAGEAANPVLSEPLQLDEETAEFVSGMKNMICSLIDILPPHQTGVSVVFVANGRALVSFHLEGKELSL